MITEFREALAGTVKLLRKHPWLLSLPLTLLWYGLHDKDQRAEFIRRAVGGAGAVNPQEALDIIEEPADATG